MKEFGSLILLILLLPTLALAGRPFSTDDASSVDKNMLEFEIGTDINFLKKITSYFSLKHGLTERMDIGFDFSYLSPDVEGLNVGVKIKFLEKGIAKSALTCRFSTQEADFDLNLIGALSGDLLDFYLNLGAVSSFEGFLFGFSPQISLLNEELILGVEITGEYMDKDYTVETLDGISWTILESLAIDLGLSLGLKNADKWCATVGLAFDY